METTASKDPTLAVLPPGEDWGFTHVLVNHREDTKANPLPLNPPKLHESKLHGFVSVADEARNTLGTWMEIPEKGPWKRTVSKQKIAGTVAKDAEALGVNIDAYLEGDGDTELRVKGDPSNDTMIDHTLKHEKHHVKDNIAIREEIIDPWDLEIAKMQLYDTVFHGDPAEAKAELYEEAGGTPAEIGKKFFDEVESRGSKYHKTTEGGPPVLTAIEKSPDQSRFGLKYRPPA